MILCPTLLYGVGKGAVHSMSVDGGEGEGGNYKSYNCH
jgi:hypothetical protein